uniref:Uncharacterized protein n=1 Tax=Helianthus annuus TaxID=4232 RepID=A0A251UMG3_HELAN
MLKIKVHYLVDSTKTVYRRHSPEISINVVCLYEIDFLNNGTFIKCQLKYWNISGRSVN